MAWIPIDPDCMWNYSTWVSRIVEDWYNLGNTEFDVGTMRFKDFICMVNFFFGLCAYLLWF
jgi:hypothetical protein